ncbi:hypothetical protein, partial [Robiginitalea aurantiaca]
MMKSLLGRAISALALCSIFIVNAQEITSFSLIDATSDTELFNLSNGLQIDLSVVQGIDLSIRTNTNPP